MHLGLSMTPFGHHPAAWREKGSSDAIDFIHLAAQVKKAQDGGLDFVFFDDRLGKRPVNDLSPQAVPFEPTTLVAALATVARRIGLIATAATSQHEPYNLARRFASLDTISKGRAGWNLVISPVDAARDQEYVELVNGLWDSWEDDAFLYDKPAGRFFAPEKMHVLNHQGVHFTVRGPLNVNRSPQGKPVISHVLTASTLDIAARSADLIFLASASPDEARVLVSDLQERLESHGRTRSDIRLLANVVPYIAASTGEARGIRDRLDALPPDGEKPGGLEVLGTPIGTADQLQHWSETIGIDGFTVLPPLVPESTDAFIDGVIPELRKRGLFRNAYEGSTLREHLGLRRLPHPVSHTAGTSR
ncbi:methylene-tetrahydromethanopterin reductase [Phyllobacterium zundukense]|uniref:Methylene-tetrahydromethanopterin reductase n=2 Tax=Phyllobacterium zundukense TaxID=1867719 RepID=A0A2N9VTN5_9HYPH|nr:methylene-tetrahydromethanopterin reductase [Phyllobacterium zundukense]PIO42853.1 methylene-tetrahydromethanopterin reductase [Phyllobacterium zundukense]